VLKGDEGNDTIVSGPGNSRLIDGGDGNDTITSLGGHSTIKGGTDDDVIQVYNDTTSSIDGGLGIDYCCGGGTHINCETSLVTCP
jgi:Ca2+-binding RTX toxin-like protein